MTAVSIAMATFNGGRHIRQQLESLATQTLLPAELVITDDGSTDDTLAVAEDFARNSPFPVHMHRNESRLGYRANFMLAAALCRSELIAFCDQDDRWYPRKISACAARFVDPDVLLVFHNAHVTSAKGRKIASLRKFRTRKAISSSSSIMPLSQSLGFTQMFRSSLLKFSKFWPDSIDHLRPHEPMAHDQWFHFLASALGKIGYLHEPLAAYVQHENNAVGWSVSSIKGTLEVATRNPSDLLLGRVRAARHCAAILDAARVDFDSVWSERAQYAAESYRRLSRLNGYRRMIYRAPKLRLRVQAFRRILATGGYDGVQTLSRRAFFKDVCLGIPAGPFLIHTA